MISTFKESDLASVMQIWLDANIEAHSFISEKYWIDNFDGVKDALPEAEVYVFRNGDVPEGFIGITDSYIAGIFVKSGSRSNGVGKQLLNHAKNIKQHLTLSVYAKNRRAVNFYLRENFKIQAQEIDETTGEAELIMVWNKESANGKDNL